MHWLVLVGFITAHLLAYLAVFRHWQVFAGERTIFAYHGLAFAVGFAVVATAFARGAIGFAALSGLLALQFIYSISFLELWSLAQGSYSLQILTRVAREASTPREEIVAACEAIGGEKKRHRLDNLLTFGLVAKSVDSRLGLSAKGAMLVRSLRTIMRFSAVRDAG
jgi:hypothetical protein